MHLLSIIMPVYNVEKYVADTIEAILHQSYSDFELILVDDGSTDSSAEICDRYSKIDTRVNVIHKINGGVSSARNTGLDEAKGDLIAFMDSDDLIDREMYEILIKNLDSTNSDVSACPFVEDHNLNKNKIVNLQNKNLSPLIFEGGVQIYDSVTQDKQSVAGYVWNKVWKRELIGAHRFREDIVMCEDSIFTWQVLKMAKRACFYDIPMYHYRIRRTSATRNSSIEKTMGALTSYELMLDDAEILSDEAVRNLSIQYLWWNYAVFKKIIRSKNPDLCLYEKVKRNCSQKSKYIHFLGGPSAVAVKSIAKDGYNRAKATTFVMIYLTRFKRVIDMLRAKLRL